MTTNFTELDRLTTSSFLASGQYAYGYALVANTLTPGSTENIWFSNAALINAGVGPGSTFARVQTVGGYLINFQWPADGQAISDGIAGKVLGAVVLDSGNSISLNDIYVDEGGIVVQAFGLARHLWTFSNPITALKLGTTEFIPDNSALEWLQVGVTTYYSAAAAGLSYLGDFAGSPAVAKGNNRETSKVQKGIIKDFLHGSNGREHKPDWLPPYFQFPIKSYREASGIAVADKWQNVAELINPAL